MDIRVFPQISYSTWQQQLKNPTFKALAQVGISFVIASSLKGFIVSLSPLAISLGVTFVALTILQPKKGRLLEIAYTLSRFTLTHILMRVTLTPLVHESGHALAAFALFKNPNIRIRYMGLFSEASTTYTVSFGMTLLGSLIGKEKSIAIVTAGGLAASTLFSMAVLKKIPECAVSQALHESSYALKAWSNSWDLSNDYYRLWMDWDIHPFIPIAFMGFGLVARNISSLNCQLGV